MTLSSTLASFSAYIGIPWANRGRNPVSGLDCWGLVWHVSRMAFARELPSYADHYTDSNGNSAADALVRLRGSYPWGIVPPSRVRQGDVVELLLGGRAWHVGIVIPGGWFLHTREGTGSVAEPLDSPRWQSKIHGFYRWLA